MRSRASDGSEEGCSLVCLRTAVTHRLPFRSEPYTLTLHLPTAAQQPPPPACGADGAPSGESDAPKLTAMQERHTVACQAAMVSKHQATLWARKRRLETCCCL